MNIKFPFTSDRDSRQRVSKVDFLTGASNKTARTRLLNIAGVVNKAISGTCYQLTGIYRNKVKNIILNPFLMEPAVPIYLGKT